MLEISYDEEQIAKRINKAREYRKYTISKFSDGIGFAENTVKSWLYRKNERSVSLENLVLISNFLEIDINYFLGIIEEIADADCRIQPASLARFNRKEFKKDIAIDLISDLYKTNCLPLMMLIDELIKADAELSEEFLEALSIRDSISAEDLQEVETEALDENEKLLRYLNIPNKNLTTLLLEPYVDPDNENSYARDFADGTSVSQDVLDRFLADHPDFFTEEEDDEEDYYDYEFDDDDICEMDLEYLLLNSGAMPFFCHKNNELFLDKEALLDAIAEGEINLKIFANYLAELVNINSKTLLKD